MHRVIAFGSCAMVLLFGLACKRQLVHPPADGIVLPAPPVCGPSVSVSVAPCRVGDTWYICLDLSNAEALAAREAEALDCIEALTRWGRHVCSRPDVRCIGEGGNGPGVGGPH